MSSKIFLPLLILISLFGPMVQTTHAQVAPAPTPVVIALASNSQLIELPKTGIPLSAIILMGLAPIGWKLRKYTATSLDKNSPDSIWQNRQLKR